MSDGLKFFGSVALTAFVAAGLTVVAAQAFGLLEGKGLAVASTVALGGAAVVLGARVAARFGKGSK